MAENESGGRSLTHNEVSIKIVEKGVKFKNKSGKIVSVNKDLSSKHIDNKTKQEDIALVDEVVFTSAFEDNAEAKYSHGWLDDNGKNNWEYWTTYLQDKSGIVWKVILNIATSTDGQKILYDISPIKKVGQSVESDTIPTKDSIRQTPEKSQEKFSERDSSGKTLTKAQQEYFKISKVVDDKGNLKVMYRGDSSDFTVF
ncbi:MAG: hypothetical protein J6A50_06670 [Clostridia bacterium]|nr:hypothetical protein [Clostridia bacterium]